MSLQRKFLGYEPNRLILDNTHCRFSPHVSVLTTGSTVEALNSDPVLHTTHLYGAIEANIGLPLQGIRMSKTVVTPGMIVVKCDVHGWMQAFIRVDMHPFHAVTDSTGWFRIPDVPTGTYELEAWHETLGQRRKTVHVTDAATETVEIGYSGLPEKMRQTWAALAASKHKTHYATTLCDRETSPRRPDT